MNKNFKKLGSRVFSRKGKVADFLQMLLNLLNSGVSTQLGLSSVSKGIAGKTSFCSFLLNLATSYSIVSVGRCTGNSRGQILNVHLECFIFVSGPHCFPCKVMG